MYRNSRIRRILVEKGTAQGQMMFWDATLDKWVHTEVSELFWDDTTKRFGILTTNPLATFDIRGDIFTDRWLERDGNTFLGVGVLGAGTLEHNAASQGYYNTGLGFKALYSITTGYRNTVLGYEAAYSNTSGFSNFALGFRALHSNTNGKHNTVLGADALYSNIGGDYNFALGYQSLYSNVSGDRNIAIGYEAGFSSVGSANILLGYKAGYYQTSSNILIIDNQSRGSEAAEITDCLIYGVFDATVTSQSLRFNVGELILASGTPYQTLWNTTHEDSDGGRESRINFKGEQSGGEITTLARIEIGHDGSADDEKGYLDIFINSGSDGDMPTKRVRIDSDGVKIGDGGTTDYVEINSTGDVVFVGSAGLAYGEINVVGNSTETTIAVQNVYVQVTIFDTNGENNNVTPDHTNDHITITKAGRYFISCSITLNSISGSGSTAEIEVKKNNGNARVGSLHVDRTLSGGGTESGAITITGIADLAAPVSATRTTYAFVDSNPDTITDSSNNFVNDGFLVGQKLTVTGTANNNGDYTIATVVAGTITLIATDTLTAESAGASMTLEGSETIEVWIKNETNTQNYVVEDITLSLMQIGG